METNTNTTISTNNSNTDAKNYKEVGAYFVFQTLAFKKADFKSKKMKTIFDTYCNDELVLNEKTQKGYTITKIVNGIWKTRENVGTNKWSNMISEYHFNVNGYRINSINFIESYEGYVSVIERNTSKKGFKKSAYSVFHNELLISRRGHILVNLDREQYNDWIIEFAKEAGITIK